MLIEHIPLADMIGPIPVLFSPAHVKSTTTHNLSMTKDESKLWNANLVKKVKPLKMETLPNQWAGNTIGYAKHTLVDPSM